MNKKAILVFFASIILIAAAFYALMFFTDFSSLLGYSVEPEASSTMPQQIEATTEEASEVMVLTSDVNTLEVGERNTLSLSYESGRPVQNAQWSSSDDLIATVDQNGTVTAVSAGSCVITVTADPDNGEAQNDGVNPNGQSPNGTSPKASDGFTEEFTNGSAEDPTEEGRGFFDETTNAPTGMAMAAVSSAKITPDTVAKVSGSNLTCTFEIIVTDKTITEINILNNYIYSNEDITFETAEGTASAYVTSCRITDRDGDKGYELFLQYQIDENFKTVDIIRLGDSGTPYSLKTFDSFTELMNSGYSAYTEELCLDEDGKVYIKSIATKYGGNTDSQVITLYDASGASLEQASGAELKKPHNAADFAIVPISNSEYIVDSEKTDYQGYQDYLNNLSATYPAFSQWSLRSCTLSGGEFHKLLPVAELSEAYAKRIEYASSEEDCATVNSSGVVTAVGGGSAKIRAYIEDLFDLDIAYCIFEVSDGSDKYAEYLKGIEGETVKGKYGSTLALYKTTVLNTDDDFNAELYLYYKSDSEQQIDRVAGDTRETILSVQVPGKREVSIDFYRTMGDSIYVVCVNESYGTKNEKLTYYRFEEGNMVQLSSVFEYRDGKYYKDEQEIEATEFHASIGVYEKLSVWYDPAGDAADTTEPTEGPTVEPTRPQT